MNPLKLTLRNFTGVRAGMGRDEITIDLEELAGDASLIAVVGPNGIGKTTILDSLQPYRIMPFRAGGYSPGSFSFYDHTYGDALKELIFEHEGTIYRSTLVIKGAGKAKKTEAYLHQASSKDGPWQPVTIPDGTISDGKADTYDRCIEHLLGSPEMFFTSVFAAQGRRQLSSYTAGEIKAVFSELLGLDHILELGVKAGDVLKAARAKLDAVQETLREAEQVDLGIESAQAERDDLRATLMLNDHAIAALKASAQAAQVAHAEAQANQRRNTEIEIRRQRLTARLAEVHARMVAETTNIDAQIAAEKRRGDEAVADLAAWTATAKTRRADLEARMAGQQALLRRRKEITQAAAQIPQAETEAAASEKALTAAQAAVDRYHAARQAVAVMRGEFGTLVETGKALSAQHQDVERRAGLTDQVPCAGTDLQPRCQLLADALTAKAKAGKLAADLAEKRAAAADLGAKIKAETEALAQMGDPEAERVTAEAALNAARRTLSTLQQTAGLLASLDTADEIIRAALADIEAIEAESVQRANAAASTEAYAAEQVAALTARRAEAVAAASADASATQAELDQLPPANADDALHAAEQALVRAEAALTDAQRDSDRLREQIGAVDGRIALLTERAAKFADARARAEKLAAEVAHWTLLRKALSQDGIVALSIDDAGPTLASLTNDLLLSCYGPRFTVAIRTQAETAKGDLKETFDIAVFDGDRDEEKSIRVMSGGERIWLNECLSRAIALYQAQQSGRQYGCLFADESDGALDAERKGMFVAMKRKVMELGGYRREFFISHAPDLWEMADAVIDLGRFRV